MATVANQSSWPSASAACSGWVAGSPKTNRSNTTLVSRTSSAGRVRSGINFAGLIGVRHFPGRAPHHVEPEQAALDRTVPHRHTARLLQPHARGQLEVGRQYPGGPAGVVLFPVRCEL